MTDNARQATCKLLELIEEGILDKDNVIMACVKYMSEDDVADMAHINDFFYDEEDDDD
jgi:enamine deaminase RidA (YjgF/YER057c/UK114 family)